MGSEKFGSSAKSGYNKGTIRSDIRYLVVSKDVRRHRLISISYITTLPCHGRGREFESRRPRHSFQQVASGFRFCFVARVIALTPNIHHSPLVVHPARLRWVSSRASHRPPCSFRAPCP